MNKGSQSKGSQREKESKPTRDKRETKQQRAFVEDLANKVKVRRVRILSLTNCAMISLEATFLDNPYSLVRLASL